MELGIFGWGSSFPLANIMGHPVYYTILWIFLSGALLCVPNSSPGQSEAPYVGFANTQLHRQLQTRGCRQVVKNILSNR